MKIVLTAKRAIVIAVSVPLIATGTFVTEAPISFAQAKTTFTKSVTGEVPRQVDLGPGTINPIQPVVQGDVVTISGTGFNPRNSEEAFLSFKLNDGVNLRFEDNQAGTDVVEVDASGTAYFNAPNVPQADGSWQGTLRIPANLQPGAYWVRVLSGTDGDPAGPLSKIAWFEVLENDGTTPLYEPDIAVKAQGFDASLQVKGFQPGETVTATIKGQPAKFSSSEQSVTAGPEGSFQTALDLTATPVLANEQAELVLTGSKGTVKNSRFRGSPEISVNTPHGSGIPLGSTVTLTVRNVPPTTSVDNMGVLGINLIEDHPDRSNAVASAAGTVSIIDIKIPMKEELLGQEMAVMLRLPGEDRNRRYDSGLTFTAAQSQPSPEPQPDPGTKPNPDPGTQPGGSSLSSNEEGNNTTQSSKGLGITGGILAVLGILAAIAASQGLLPLHLLPF